MCETDPAALLAAHLYSPACLAATESIVSVLDPFATSGHDDVGVVVTVAARHASDIDGPDRSATTRSSGADRP